MAVLFDRARHRVPIAVVVVSGALMIAGCGSSGRPSTASTSATTSSSANKKTRSGYANSQLAAAACIRSHGFPNFPDPTFGAGGAQVNLSTSINMFSSGFQLAERECAKLGLALAGYAPTATATPAEMAQALTIARCMRAHGVPNWPDPTTTIPSNLNGYGVQQAVPGPAGGPVFVIPYSINVEAPAVTQAEKACGDE